MKKTDIETFFERLAAEALAVEVLTAYLSTHPASSERIAEIGRI